MSINMELDIITRDIKLTPGKNLSLVSGNKNLAQQIECRLRTVKGEWFLNYQLGIPYFANILLKTKDKSRIDTLYKNEILKLTDVAKIEQFESTLDKNQREYTITTLVVKSKLGEIIVV